MTETISLKSGQGAFYSTNVSYRLYNLSLALCSRATLVAEAYQEFRIRRITLIYRTTQDTFLTNLGAVPQLYAMVDKRGAIPINFDEQTLQSMGAVPRRFDDKNVMVKYTPSVLQSSLTDPALLTVQVASARDKPWLPTNISPNVSVFAPSDVDHFGLSWRACVPLGAQAVLYDIDIKVDFEYRKARFNTFSPNAPPALDWNKQPATS